MDRRQSMFGAMGRVSREGKHAQACAAANPEPARSRSRKKGDGKRSRWKVPRRRRGARDRARGGCAAMRERVPNAEFDGIDRYRVRSGLDRTVDARDARTVEVDGGLDGEGAPVVGPGSDGRDALVEALTADGGRHTAGRGGCRDARHLRSLFPKVSPSLLCAASVLVDGSATLFAFTYYPQHREAANHLLSTTPGSCQSQDRPRHRFSPACSPYDFV